MTAPADDFVLPPHLADWSWIRDGVHGPRPLPPLVGDVVEEWCALALGRAIKVVNGYTYMGLGPGSKAASYEIAPQQDPAEAWYQFYVPRVQTVANWVRDRDWDALSLGEILAALPDVLQATGSAFASTMAPLMRLGGPLGELTAFCSRHFPDGEAMATALLAGSENATSAIGEGLAALAASAAADPQIAGAVRSRNLDALNGPAAHEWRSKFDAFIEGYGRGNQTWFDFHEPTWSEDPAVPLAMVARLLDAGAGGELPRERAAAARDAALQAALAALPGEAEREELRGLLARNADYVGVIEDRARWQLVLAAGPRYPLLAAGRKLQAAGSIASAEDVFFLKLATLRAAAGEPTAPSLAAEVEAARAAWLRWRDISPPDSLGAELPPGLDRMAPLRQQFGLGAPRRGEDGILRGFAASKGAITARARVIHDLADSELLEPGEVLVCHNTAPPWTPLFAIAAAVVVEAGGPLSHAAIAAREYAIPAVVAVRDATRLIADGTLVQVDGTAGTVEILEG